MITSALEVRRPYMGFVWEIPQEKCTDLEMCAAYYWYIANQLSGKMLHAFEHHLTECSNCRTTLDNHNRLTAVLDNKRIAANAAR